MKLRHFATSALAVTCLSMTAQTEEGKTLSDSINLVGQQYAQQLDSLASYMRENPAVPAVQVVLANPYYFSLFTGNTLQQRPISESIGKLANGKAPASLVPQSIAEIQAALADYYAAHPDKVQYNLAALEEIAAKEEETAEEPKEEATDTNIATVEIPDITEHHDELPAGNFEIKVKRPNFWTVKGAYSTQFMQYYVSDNWYKGGENHLSLLATFEIEANYDNKERVTFSNKLESKLGFQTYKSNFEGSDALNHFDRKFRTNADLLRMTNKLGIKAKSNWYYSAMLQTWTQFYSGFKSSSANEISRFMSPFESVFSVGMDYKVENKRLKFNVNIAPAALDFKYCNSSVMKRDQIKDAEHIDRHYRLDVGSALTANAEVKLCKQVTWQSRFFAFYNFKTVNSSHDQIKWEWENTINLKVNKYLSSKIFLFPRYEGGLKKSSRNMLKEEQLKKFPGDKRLLQFNEFISVGFDINF